MLKIAFSPVYKYELPEGHRFPMEKYEILPEQLVYEGTVSNSNFFEPNPLTKEQVLLTHLPEYYSKLEGNDLTPREQRKIGFPMTPKLFSRGLIISAGTLECAYHAMENGVAMNIAGGTHHAYPDRGEGFCVLNDIAIASNCLLNNGVVNKILIVDLDVHQGNGNAYIFRNTPEVFTFSMHGEKNYPLRKETSNLDIGLPDKAGDDYYLNLLYNKLPELIDNVEPDLIFYQAGVDIMETDKLGRLRVSKKGVLKRDEFVFEICKKNKIPVVVSMGGGYPEKLTDLIDAHANTYRAAAKTFF